VDRDDDPFNGFELNSHCLITDLSCVGIYAFDFDSFRGFVRRAFYVEFTSLVLDNILAIARTATVVLWLKERKLSGFGMAPIERSLAATSGLITLDLEGWLDRSLKAGGDPELWRGLKTDYDNAKRDFDADYRRMLRIHDLDRVFRFWLRRATGQNLPEGWIEQFLRGQASYEMLSRYDFFTSIGRKCTTELTTP
jgi:hypothetical protein